MHTAIIGCIKALLNNTVRILIVLIALTIPGVMTRCFSMGVVMYSLMQGPLAS
jgi:hypothetical protein